MTIKELAELADVSVATASRAFKAGADISPETREKVLRIAAQAGYRPKPYSQRKQNVRKNSVVGVILDCSSYPAANHVLTGISEVMSREGVNVICANSQGDVQQAVAALDFLRKQVDGLIFVPPPNQTEYSVQFLDEISRTVPVVTLIRPTKLSHLDIVQVDSYSPTYSAINLLLDHGHKNIAILCAPIQIKGSYDKLSAYMEALRNHAIPIRSEYICYGETDEKKICQLAKEVLSRSPEITALFTCNITITRGCLHALDELGLRVPEDIALVSYGNDTSFSLQQVQITAIANPHIAMGQQAAHLVLRKMRERRHGRKRPPEKIVLIPELLIRGSEIFPQGRGNQ